MYKIVLSPFASKELDESFDYYDEQTEGLGKRFIHVVDEALTIISENPKAFPKKKRNYRDMVMDIFPYIIVYEIAEKESIINILHIFHTSRSPKFKYSRK